MPKAFSEFEKELIGKRLLEQGYKQFSAYGLKKTNIEEIAKAAGISKGAFYNFYESKEALFMDVIEQVEIRVRREILAVIDQPGPSPRARLFALLKKAFSLFQEVPILKIFTGGDFDLLFSRIPAEKLQAHLASDQGFLEELIARCQEAGIPIRLPPEQIVGLLYPVVVVMLHEDEMNRNAFNVNMDVLLELVAAYCLGEVEIQHQQPASPVFSEEGNQK
jgi:AcrR family transcriptional regulator